MQTINISRGASNYLRDCFHTDSVSNLNSDQAASLCDDADIDFSSEAGELWSAYCGHFQLMAHQSPEKFRNSKFYREHL